MHQPTAENPPGLGYLRTPTIHDGTVVFVCDDDLWSVPASGGLATRLTAGVAEASGPLLSPDGSLLGFVGREEGPADIYVMPATGGPARRLTYQGGMMLLAGFDPADGSILYATDADRPFTRVRWLHRVSLEGGLPELIGLGPVNEISHGPGGAMVLARHGTEPAHWKRYRGGRVGELWVDPAGSGEFQRLIELAGNLAAPCWVGERIYFLSDHEGVGNVYSCTPAGQDLRRHTDHEEFYARALRSDGHRLVYAAGARLWLLEPTAAGPVPIEVRLASAGTQRNRQFVDAAKHLDTAALSADGSALAVTSRGKAYEFGNWAGPVRQYGRPDGVRYRLLTRLAGSGRLVAAASDESAQERLVVFDPTDPADAAGQILSDLDIGRVQTMLAAPREDLVAITNHRHQLLLLDLRGERPELRTLDQSPVERIEEPAWAPDARWLAYNWPLDPKISAIKVARVETGESWQVTEPVLGDRSPAFDPAGRWLYFIGTRRLDPVYDEAQFDLGFPMAARPYALTLRADLPPPFLPDSRPTGADAAPAADNAAAGGEADSGEAASGEAAPVPEVEIEFDGIARRVVPAPVPDARYRRLAATRDKLLFSVKPVAGARDQDPLGGPAADLVLEMCDLDSGQQERIVGDITDFSLSRDHRSLLLRCGNKLRVIKAGEKLIDGDPKRRSETPGRDSGWVDLGRVRVSVRPGAEWRQMFREAWRLQLENFWSEDMAGIDWDEVYQRYQPLVDRVATRSEFSDLLWELQGELGTSHAYESGGAYRQRPDWKHGYLGVDWRLDPATGDYLIDRVLDGDQWWPDATSPFNRPGLGVRAGDRVLAIGGVPVGPDLTPSQLLVNQAGQEITVAVRRGEQPVRTVTVKALADERQARYRDWVAANRALVHQRSGGRVGYLHIPDMIANGFAEFHRGFLAEYDREALVIDVRYNRGGHASGLLLQKLCRRRIAYAYPRRGEPRPHLKEAPRGPLVAITNEHAGSDGDIFSHSFKRLGLGPLVGKRTWGGVIGIHPRHRLADGTQTTQPEYSFGFDDVGWQVENYGTDPDIEVEIAPQDYRKGVDPQLERAIECALAGLAEQPAHQPTHPPRPRLARPPLPPR